VLGVDVSTTAVKAAVVSADGEVLGEASVEHPEGRVAHRRPPRQADGRREQHDADGPPLLFTPQNIDKYRY
jgi:sugar (pentulose or hexulose) kinase